MHSLQQIRDLDCLLFEFGKRGYAFYPVRTLFVGCIYSFKKELFVNSEGEPVISEFELTIYRTEEFRFYCKRIR